jgi:hypothetical protein
MLTAAGSAAEPPRTEHRYMQPVIVHSSRSSLPGSTSPCATSPRPGPSWVLLASEWLVHRVGRSMVMPPQPR